MAVRVVAVTQSDPFFTAAFFKAFLEERANDRLELVEIVLLRNFNESRPALARRLFKLYGPVDFLRLLGRYVAAAVSDRIGRPRSVEALAARYGVPLVRLSTINDPSYLRTLADRDVDVLLSVAAPEIFRRAALEAVRYVLNVHSGQLPHYRGMMPTFWALSNGDTRVVVTLHEMNERLDAGRLIAEFPVDGEWHVSWPPSEPHGGRSRARSRPRDRSTMGFQRGVTRDGSRREGGGCCDRAGVPRLLRRGRLVPRRESAVEPRRRPVVVARGAGRAQYARAARHPRRDRGQGQGHVLRAGMDRPAAPDSGAPDGR